MEKARITDQCLPKDYRNPIMSIAHFETLSSQVSSNIVHFLRKKSNVPVMRQPTYFNFSILPFLFFLLFSLCLATSNSNNHSEHFVQCLLQNSDNSTAMSQIIYTMKNPLYTEILDRLAQNLRFRTPETPKPVAVLTPSHESQIKTAIYCSKKVGLQMRIRSGGNDMEGSSYVSYVPFFVLDTYGFRSIDVDNAAKTAWVGTGATYGEFYYALNQSDTSLAFPGPYWPTVGVGGHICSGGFGGLIRKHGVAADNVVDARIINAKGEILDRESMGEDLFWALRGGSCASFGVVIAFKLKLVPVPKSFPAFNVKRTLDENALSLIYKWQHIAPSLPKEITLTTQVFSFLPTNSTKQNIIANFVAIFLGDMDGLISLLDKHFPEIGVTKNDISMVDWATSNIFHLSFPIENSAQILRNRTPPDAVPYLKMVSDFFQHPIPKKGIKKMLDIMMEAKAGEAFLEMTPLKGIMEEIPESSIPFPHRNNLFLIGEKIGWFEPDHAEERLAWSRKFRKFLGKYVADNPRGAFVNYRNDELGVNNVDGSTSFEQAKSWGIPYYKGNFERLARIKTVVDPENYFKYEQSIPILPVHSKL